MSLGNVLFMAFERSQKSEYLDESISMQSEALAGRSLQFGRFNILHRLLMALITRFLSHPLAQDLDEVMRLFPMAVNDAYARIPDRFEHSCLWAFFARMTGHPSVLSAYKSAMSLMKSALDFSPTLQLQHARLVKMRDTCCGKMPLRYASYQIDTGRYEEAIETLEQGRALLWSEMRGFRSFISRLRAADPALAEKFAAVNKELEILTTSIAPGGNVEPDLNGVGLEGGEEMDPFGRLVVKQQALVEEREKLASQIQSLPGFEGFLKGPSFGYLRSAAVHGPVVVINHCVWRSDIIILLHDSPPSIITTTDDFYNRVIELRDRLVSTRKEHRLESNQYQRALRSVLEGLYELVGRPVIEGLHKLNVPEQSRVWWCPTSVFCSLPLHAMGPIPSDDSVKRFFLDLYIPSYTPTLSALVESRKSGRQTLEKPSLLLVAQPDEYLLQAWPEIWHIERLRTKVTTLTSKRATPSGVVEGLQDHRFAHFVCHGKLETGEPFDASFQLYGGQAPYDVGHRAISTCQCRVCLPLGLSHGGND
jgi:hypothetical protein